MRGLDARLRRNLAAFERRAADDGVRRRAAVAVAVLEPERAPHVLIAKRVPRGLNAGQWAPPAARSGG